MSVELVYTGDEFHMPLLRGPHLYVVFTDEPWVWEHYGRVYIIYYVGKTIQPVHQRIRQHMNKGSQIGNLLMSDWGLKIDVYRATSREELADLEKWAITRLRPWLNDKDSPNVPLKMWHTERGGWYFSEELLEQQEANDET